MRTLARGRCIARSRGHEMWAFYEHGLAVDGSVEAAPAEDVAGGMREGARAELVPAGVRLAASPA